jgi:hypothetical protein
MIRRLIAPFALVLAIAACTAPLGELTVESYSPEDGATDVARDAVVTATFNRNVAADSLDGNFTLTGGGSSVDGEVTWDVASLTATFTPDALLAYDTTYTATLSGDITTPNNVTVAGSVSWSFTTVEDPTVDPDPDPAVTGLSVSPGSADLGVSASSTVALAATVTTVGSPAPSTDVTWESSDEAVATVDADGLVTAVAAGTATITATSVADGDFDASADITVYALAFADETEYEAFSGDADVSLAPFSIAFPELASGLSGGLAPFTFAIVDGALPDDFVTVEFEEATSGLTFPSETYAVELDAATGEISGSTGYPGTFTGTVMVTDALGQTLEADFSLELALSLVYLDAALEEPETNFVFVRGVDGGPTIFPYVLVPGDQVRVAGINTDGLPDDGSLDLNFELVCVGARFYTSGNFTSACGTSWGINEADGTISRLATSNGGWWTYDVTVTDAVSTEVAVYRITLTASTYTGPTVLP